MPTITPQGRPIIGANNEVVQQPRRSVVQSTGMGPSIRGTKQATTETPTVIDPTAKTGQPGTTVETPAPVVTLSSHATALARSQQKLQREIQTQRDKESAWEKEKAGFIPKESIKAKLQQNAAEAIQEAFGMSYEEVVNLLVAQQNGKDPVQELAAKVEKIEKSQVEANNKQFDAILNQYKTEAKGLIAKDAEKYAFLEVNPDWIDGAVQFIVDEWETNPDNVVSIDEALALAEENLRDEAKKQASVLEKISKSKPEAVATETAPQTRTLPPPQTTAAPKTLSHSIESVATRPINQFQHMSMKERIAQAVARASK